MTKDIISKIALYASAIGIVTFVIGTLIINNHLSGYRIVDFNLIKPHAIAVGFSCILFLIINGIYSSIFIKWDNVKVNSPVKVFFITVFKLVFICNIMFFIFSDKSTILNTTYSIGPIFLDNFAVINLFEYSIIGIPVFLNNFRTLSSKKGSWFKNLLRLIAYGGALCGVIIFIMFFNYKLYFRFFLLEGGILFAFYIFFLVVRKSIIDNSGDHDENKTDTPKSFFSQGQMQGKVLYLFYSYVAMQSLGFLIFLILGYTKFLFPQIPQSYGGGKLDNISYIVSGDTIIGKKVYETEKYVFLSMQDSSIQKLDWDKIERILKP